ncbi:hypothetical protein [Nonomuraea sp. NPDC049695]|uniref:hypothetical protein n=1 Tax=Nonomuraea sp. NPDC049695 TaxID=3154734 RepID=UPI003422019D
MRHVPDRDRKDSSGEEKEPRWRVVLLAILSILLVLQLLWIAGMMFLLYFDGPR